MSVLQLDGIGKSLAGEVHLHPCQLTLEPGSVTVLLGRTRAGKTSLLRLLAGLDQPSSGRLLRDGRDITRQRLQRRRVAMVYQEFINYPNLTVLGNIASPLRTRGLARGPSHQRARELAALVHIEHLLERRPHELSGGQQQRLAIARALASEAELLLLDEPLVNLDLKLREELLEELAGIFAERALTVVYATSDSREALGIGGSIAVLHEGAVLQHAPALESYHRPACDTVGRILSDPPMNIWPVAVRDGRARLGPDLELVLSGHLAGLGDGVYRFGLRAHHLHLRQGEPTWIRLPSLVDLAEINGSETFVHARHHELAFVVQEEGAHHHASGAAFDCFLDPSRLLVFAADGGLVRSYQEGHG